MSIQQTKRQSDLEKRLQIIRRQVYGKEFKVQSSEFVVKNNITISSTDDLSYLKQDLLKILTFSSIAIGAQIILKLKFF